MPNLSQSNQGTLNHQSHHVLFLSIILLNPHLKHVQVEEGAVFDDTPVHGVGQDLNDEQAAQVVVPPLGDGFCELPQGSHEKFLADMGDLQK